LLISFSTLRSNFNKAIGYGHAGQMIVESLNKLGHSVPYQTPKAPVQLNFSQPNHFKLHKDQYQIGVFSMGVYKNSRRMV